MSDRIDVQADDKLKALIWRTYGLAAAFEALGGAKPKSTLPGFALAVALVEKELADMRANMSGGVYRTAAKAGHDLSKVSAIYTDIVKGVPVVSIESADLVDQAED